MRPASCRHTPAPGRDSRGADRAEDEGDSEHDERDRPEEVEVEVGQELADEEEGAHDDEDGAEDDGPVAAAAASGGASRSAPGTTMAITTYTRSARKPVGSTSTAQMMRTSEGSRSSRSARPPATPAIIRSSRDR